MKKSKIDKLHTRDSRAAHRTQDIPLPNSVFLPLIALNAHVDMLARQVKYFLDVVLTDDTPKRLFFCSVVDQEMLGSLPIWALSGALEDTLHEEEHQARASEDCATDYERLQSFIQAGFGERYLILASCRVQGHSRLRFCSVSLNTKFKSFGTK